MIFEMHSRIKFGIDYQIGTDCKSAPAGDPELQKYNKEYNTRVVTSDDFRNALKNKIRD
jgi:hypothetical protein